jgi:hypothetical protein
MRRDIVSAYIGMLIFVADCSLKVGSTDCAVTAFYFMILQELQSAQTGLPPRVPVGLSQLLWSSRIFSWGFFL